ncbi:MAG: hypothetical protein QOF76_3816, partial [Solirubrobacteraceae bacterium]|nr:hypothetical protein [Solirubrobacteraceae bacterium]
MRVNGEVHRLLLVLALALAAAAPAGAATTTIGSDLKGDASFAIANPNDWSVWNAQLVTGGPATVPVDGELNAVSIKGIALQNSAGTPFVVHIQVLHPGSTGGVSITVTSEALAFPSSGDPQQITRFGRDALDLSNTRMCVKKGDFVAFSTNGGAEVTPPGVALQVFKRNPGSAMQVFKTSDGHYPGSFSGTTQESQELLMQAEIGTGANARPFCGGTEGSGGGGGGGGATPTPTVAPTATATPGGGPTPTP